LCPVTQGQLVEASRKRIRSARSSRHGDAPEWQTNGPATSCTSGRLDADVTLIAAVATRTLDCEIYRQQRETPADLSAGVTISDTKSDITGSPEDRRPRGSSSFQDAESHIQPGRDGIFAKSPRRLSCRQQQPHVLDTQTIRDNPCPFGSISDGEYR
jgi:hypothetical protein